MLSNLENLSPEKNWKISELINSIDVMVARPEAKIGSKS